MFSRFLRTVIGQTWQKSSYPSALSSFSRPPSTSLAPFRYPVRASLTSTSTSISSSSPSPSAWYTPGFNRQRSMRFLGTGSYRCDSPTPTPPAPALTPSQSQGQVRYDGFAFLQAHRPGLGSTRHFHCFSSNSKSPKYLESLRFMRCSCKVVVTDL